MADVFEQPLQRRPLHVPTRETAVIVCGFDQSPAFALTKEAGIVSLYYRPFRQLQFSIAPDVESNNVLIFDAGTVEQYLEQQAQQGQGVNSDLARILRLPTGQSDAFAQRFLVTWDRRDNSFNAHTGTVRVLGRRARRLEARSSRRAPNAARSPYQRLFYGAEGWTSIWANTPGSSQPAEAVRGSEGHFLRFTETFAAYLPITRRSRSPRRSASASTYSCHNRTTRRPTPTGCSSWAASTRCAAGSKTPSSRRTTPTGSRARLRKPSSDPTKFTIAQVALRGGNLMVNPRARAPDPVYSPLETVLFLDTGNLWADASYPFTDGFHFRSAPPSGPASVCRRPSDRWCSTTGSTFAPHRWAERSRVYLRGLRGVPLRDRAILSPRHALALLSRLSVFAILAVGAPARLGRLFRRSRTSPARALPKRLPCNDTFDECLASCEAQEERCERVGHPAAFLAYVACTSDAGFSCDDGGKAIANPPCGPAQAELIQCESDTDASLTIPDAAYDASAQCVDAASCLSCCKDLWPSGAKEYSKAVTSCACGEGGKRGS